MSTVTPNNSTGNVLPTPLLNLYTLSDIITYISLGSVIILLNFLTFAITLSDKSLRQKSALLCGIATGNSLLGMHMLSFGIYRYIYDSQLITSTQIASCVQLIFPLLYPIAFNTVALFLVLAGLERLLATAAPKWFWKKWKPKTAWILSLAAHAFILSQLALAVLLPVSDRLPCTWACNFSSIFGLGYVRFISAFSAASGFVSAILTTTALIVGIWRFRKLPVGGGETGRYRRQLQLCKSMATISVGEMAFMAVPNTLSLLYNAGVRFPAFIRPQNSTYTNAVSGMLAFAASMLFNVHFRTVALNFLRFKRVPLVSNWTEMKKTKTAVRPVTPGPVPAAAVSVQRTVRVARSCQERGSGAKAETSF